MSVLVTYGSKRGGTAGLAQMVADGLQAAGQTADVVPARQARSLGGYDAVVVGGALYALHWHRDARRFVKRHAAELQRVPTFFFSSGPLDDSASTREIPPVKGVQALMDRVGAKKHMTFGGRLAPDAKGFPASAMAKKHAGDWRDAKQVRDWTAAIDLELRARAARV
ncbi:MAG TPA: flavodoxin domain-containing protein [Acidimicrobiales bacterium]|nr:flavodoxin domain-containing protein [Acidimicrobiales bacterium]